MKTASTELFDLIKSLNKHEKAYFNRFCSLYNKEEQQYQILFDLINNQKEYDENELKKCLKNNNLKTYLPQAKNYLYHRILESMRAYHAQRNKLQELRYLLIDIDFLIQKDLNKQAQKMLTKAFKTALKAKLWVIVLQLWRIQFTLWDKNNFETVTLQDLTLFTKQTQEVLQKEANALELKTLQAELRHWVLKKGDLSRWDLAEQLKICQQKLLDTKALSTEAAFYKSFGLANYLRINQAYQESIEEYQKGFNLFNESPDLYTQLLEIHLTSLTHWIGVSINLLDEEKGQKVLGYLETILQKQKKNLSPKDYIKYYAYYQFLTIKAAFDYGYYNNSSISFIDNSERALKKIWNQVDRQVQLVILDTYAHISLAKENYADLMKWENAILDSKQKNLRADLFDQAHIWISIAYFELKEYDLLSYQIRNLRRQKIDNHPISKIILDTLYNCIKNMDNQIYWQKMVEDLEQYAKERDIYPPIIIYTWALAKYKKQSFSTVHIQTKKAKRSFLTKGVK